MSVGQPAAVANPAKAEVAEVGSDSMRIKFIWLVVLFVMTVILFLGGTMFIQGRKGDITVPPLLGKTWDEAQYEVQDKGIKLVDDGRAYSDEYPAGQICAVSPMAGSTVPKDNPEVKVKISSGPSQVAVPDVTGLTEAQANEMIVHEGFTVGKVRQAYSDKVPVNAIISQEPSGGVRRQPGSSIDMVISNGPKPESEEPSQPEPSEEPRKFNVKVEVPEDAEGEQEVRIVVNDDRGETTAYQESRQPGDQITATVTTYGSSAEIKVYVGGDLVSDDTY